MTHYSDFHTLIWACGIIGTIGGAVGIGVGVVRWMNAIYEKASHTMQNIGAIQTVAQNVAEVKAAVDVVQTNHFVHIQESLEKSIEILENIDTNIKILVDRGTRL